MRCFFWQKQPWASRVQQRPRSALSVLNPTEAGWRPRRLKFMEKDEKGWKSHMSKIFEIHGLSTLWCKSDVLPTWGDGKDASMQITHSSNSSDIPSRLPGEDATRALFVFPVARALVVLAWISCSDVELCRAIT